MKLLFDILRHRRPANSSGEKIFIKMYLDSVKGMQSDAFGNRFIEVGEGSTTMFSCHTDTVHQNDSIQEVIVDPVKEHLFTSGVLGADDGTGIWLMLKMIEHGVKGFYVFHREEEIGGNGSTYFAENNQDKLRTMLRCIAFDRKGYDSIITEQMGVCCSDEFATQLAGKFNALYEGFLFRPDDTGLFTDSANYTHLIPECTNISVGYFNQHMPTEYQDTHFAARMLEAVLKLDWETLGVFKDVEEEYSYYNGYGGTGFDNYGATYKPANSAKGNVFGNEVFKDLYANKDLAFDRDLDALYNNVKEDDFESALDMIANDPELGTSLIFELYNDIKGF